jgi:hypothetical protein
MDKKVMFKNCTVGLITQSQPIIHLNDGDQRGGNEPSAERFEEGAENSHKLNGTKI